MNIEIRQTGIALLFMAGVSLMGCRGDDGEIGPAGPQGQIGPQGQPGGKGEGLEELTADGGFIANFSGKYQDGTSFSTNVAYKYAFDLSTAESLSKKRTQDTVHISVAKSLIQNTSTIRFSFVAIKSASGMYSFVKHKTNYGYHESIIEFFTEVPSGNNRAVKLDTYSDAAITDYSYDANTGVVKFKASGVIPAGQNSTNSDLNYSITADVKVYRLN